MVEPGRIARTGTVDETHERRSYSNPVGPARGLNEKQDSYARTVPRLMETREVRVLVVEDSPEERRLISLELSEVDEPAFRTCEASRLSEAEDELRKGRTDVVLLDLSLPDSQGLKGLVQLCHEFPTLPVVVFTGLDDQEIALQALREGGQDFLVKGQAEPGVLKRVLLHAIERKRVDVALNDSRESLREAQRLETLGRLAGKIAHDFNNILTTIVGFSDLLLEDLEGQACIEDIMEIKKAGERGAALTSSILSFSRRERPTLEALCANDALDGISGMLNQLLPKNIAVKFEKQDDLPKALADLGQVEQALVNLVANARDAMPGGGTITVRTGERTVSASQHHGPGLLPRPGHYVTISVEDTGSGMDDPTLDRIFEPFFTTKPKGSGTGLGLATVVSIVRGCQGGIEVQSQPGLGTTFVLYFPQCNPANSAKNPLAMPPEHVAASGLDMPCLETKEPLEGRGRDLQAALGSESDSPLSPSEMAEQMRYLYHVVSHDLHEPLRMVSSYLGLIKRRGQDQLANDLLEFIDYAVDGSQRMQGMLDGILRYSRTLKAIPAAEPTSVKAIYDRVLEAMPEAGFIRWEGEDATLLGSTEHLATILRELISNAVKFSNPESPQVVVACRAEGEGYRIEISDNGPGIAADEVDKCFRLLGRLHGRDDFPGLGVGLTVAQCLAEKYGATLTLGPSAEGGTMATLHWPGVRAPNDRLATL